MIVEDDVEATVLAFLSLDTGTGTISSEAEEEVEEEGLEREGRAAEGAARASSGCGVKDRGREYTNAGSSLFTLSVLFALVVDRVLYLGASAGEDEMTRAVVRFWMNARDGDECEVASGEETSGDMLKTPVRSA